MSDLKSEVENEPYGAALGVRVDEIGESRVVLGLPFKDENSNPGRILHGGVAASLINIASLTLGRAALDAVAGPLHVASLQVCYLSAAVGEEITAEASLLRKGKELCFVDVNIRTPDGKAIARGLATVRGRFGAPQSDHAVPSGDDGSANPGVMGPFLPKRVPFIGARGMVVENMSGGRSRITMPFQDNNAGSHGGVHEGAILALLDTTGAMAGWATTGPGPYKASTVAIQAQLRAPADAEELVAYGRTVQRDREILWCDVEVASRKEGRLIAGGTVVYRIVIPATS